MVSSMRAAGAIRKPMMVFQAFVDDSYNQNGEFVLAGHVASAEAWARFTQEWDALLPTGGTLAPNGQYHFKMKEMAANPERMERLPAFWWIIQKHVSVSLSCRINVAELRRARGRISVPNGPQINWGFWANPYLVASRCLMDMFHNNREKIKSRISVDQKVDFFFDKQKESASIWEAWGRYMDSRPPEIRALYGDRPRFEDDHVFKPLQAADFWAWWIRKWSEDGNVRHNIQNLDFGKWKGVNTATVFVIHFSFSEESLVEAMISAIRERLGPDAVIQDSRASP
jgi:hypothetical protein